VQEIFWRRSQQAFCNFSGDWVCPFRPQFCLPRMFFIVFRLDAPSALGMSDLPDKTAMQKNSKKFGP
jgi:hypothetical protein